jgi:hypothetical protein
MEGRRQGVRGIHQELPQHLDILYAALVRKH